MLFNSQGIYLSFGREIVISLALLFAQQVNGHCCSILRDPDTSSASTANSPQNLEDSSKGRKKAQEIVYQNSQFEMDFFSRFLAKKGILGLNGPVNQELQNISHLIRVPISSYLYNDALSGKQYTSEELKQLQVSLWETYRQQLEKGEIPFGFTDEESLGYGEDDHPAQIHSQNSFGNLIIGTYAMNGADNSTTLIKKHGDTDGIQKNAAKILYEIIAGLPSEYKEILGFVRRISLLPTTLPYPLSANPWDFSLTIGYDALLDKNTSVLQKKDQLIHELAHIKHFLVMLHEQQEGIQNTIGDRLNRILGEKTPNIIRINDDNNRDILFFWLDDIPQEIKRKLGLNGELDYTIESSSLRHLTNEESNTLKGLEVVLDSCVSRGGLIHPYSKEKYTIPGGRGIFGHLRLRGDEYLEYISTTVEFYYSNRDRFINVWYKSDEKLREIVDTILIPHGFIDDFRSKLPDDKPTS